MKPETLDLLNKFDVEAWLQSEGVLVSHEGKNISSGKGWVGIKCPFCIDGDPSEHLGVNTDSKAVKCWRCGKHSIFSLIKEISRTRGFSETANLMSKFQNRVLTYYERSERSERGIPQSDRIISLDFASENLDSLYTTYLESRNYDPLEIQLLYKIMGTGFDGPYKYRILIPFMHRNKVVTFTARDVTGKQDPPYKQCSEEKSIISPKRWLYNLSSSEDTVLVVEGPLDVWRIGGNTVATSGIEYTPEQVLLLTKFRRVFILFDTEEQAQIKAKQLASEVATLVSEVVRLELDFGDPGELSKDDANHLRRHIFGKVW